MNELIKLELWNKILEISITMPNNEYFHESLNLILEVTDSKYGTFGYLDENGDLVVPSLTIDIWDKCRIPNKDFIFPKKEWGKGIWCKALREGKTFYSNTISNVPEGHISIQRNISLPIKYRNKVIGLIQVANKAIDYIIEDIELLEIIAERIAPILYSKLKRKIKLESFLEQVNKLQ